MDLPDGHKNFKGADERPEDASSISAVSEAQAAPAGPFDYGAELPAVDAALKQHAIEYRAERDRTRALKNGNGAHGGTHVDQEIDRLARLAPYAYDLVRDHHAADLGIRIGTLDRMVSKCRKNLGLDDDKISPPFRAVEPSPHPVAGDGLLHQIVRRLKWHVIFSDEAANAVALWIAFAWTHDAATHSPMSLVTSAERDSGKTTLLGLLNLTSPRGLMVADASPAVLFRMVEKWHPTLVVDEADDQFKENPQLRAVINSGWTRGAGIPRCHPDTHEPEIFSTFGPKAIGMKGRSIPDTTLSRAIVIEMIRKKPGEFAADFEHIDDSELDALRRQLARWSEDNVKTLCGARPDMPEGFHNRLAANWRPLLAIADLAGGEWPRLAREAAVALAPKDTSSIGTTLLQDIKAIFAEKDTDRLPSAEITAALHAFEDRPWAEWGRAGKPISANQLARILKPFVIVSGTIRTEHGTAKGYHLHQFGDAFERYLGPVGGSETSQRHNPCGTGTSPTFQNVTPIPDVTVQKCEKPLRHNDCDVVTFQNGGKGLERESGPEGHVSDVSFYDIHRNPEDRRPPATEAARCEHCHQPGANTDPLVEVFDGQADAQLHRRCMGAWLTDSGHNDGLDIPPFLRRSV